MFLESEKKRADLKEQILLHQLSMKKRYNDEEEIRRQKAFELQQKIESARKKRQEQQKKLNKKNRQIEKEKEEKFRKTIQKARAQSVQGVQRMNQKHQLAMEKRKWLSLEQE